jgi:serine/threonine protein kinase
MNPNDSQREPIDLLAEEFVDRCRKGEQPSYTEYETRYPALATQIRALFPAVAVMEQFNRLRKPGESGVGKLPVQLGDFLLVREIGRGGMGIVYEAIQESIGRVVALKVLPKHALLDPKRRDRFQHEAQAAERMHHTNIVPVYGSGEVDGLPYYFMQFIAGKSWQLLIAAWKRDLSENQKEGSAPSTATAKASEDTLPSGPAEPTSPQPVSQPQPEPAELLRSPGHAAQVARMGIQAALALDYAHEQGTLHRDIKPSNFLLDEHGTVWVTDFGLAKLSGRESLTSTGDLIGTLNYMSPENFQGQADARSDIYSLGLTLYELATLQPAFNEADPGKLIKQVSEKEPVRPSLVTPDIPHDLETIILKAIARNPKHRYQTARELADDLQRFLEGQPIWARRSATLKQLGRWCRRHQGSCVAIVACLLAVVMAVAGNLRTREALAEAEMAREAEKKMSAEAARQDQEAANVYGRLGDMHRRLKQAAEAQSAYGRATVLYEKLAAEHPDVPEYAVGLARTRAKLGSTPAVTTGTKQAESLLRQAIAVPASLIEKAPDVVLTLGELCLARLVLADLLQGHGQGVEAQALRKEAISMSQDARLAAALSDSETLRKSHVLAELVEKLRRLHKAGADKKTSGDN